MTDNARARVMYAGLVYTEHDTGPLLMDLHVPAGAGSQCPVVVFLHGGGWFTGDRHLAPDPSVLCSRGIAVASIDYRLSGTALFPAQLHDARSAVRFLRDGADRYGLDDTAIGAWGSSAGGHLAALLGLTSASRQLPGEADTDVDASVRAVAESYGPTTLVAGEIDSGAALPGMASPETTPEGRVIGGDPAALPTEARAASPLHYVTSHAPPFQISHGTADVLVDAEHSRRLFEALSAAGVDVDLYLVDGYRHGFLNPAGRSDVPLPAVMDDGRLVEHGPARARHSFSRGGEASSTDTTFGFDTIAEFFASHLLPADVNRRFS